MYVARDNFVYYRDPTTNEEELFLTVHQTKGSEGYITTAEQAEKLASILNGNL